MAICIKIDELCIKNDGLCTKNDNFDTNAQPEAEAGYESASEDAAPAPTIVLLSPPEPQPQPELEPEPVFVMVPPPVPHAAQASPPKPAWAARAEEPAELQHNAAPPIVLVPETPTPIKMESQAREEPEPTLKTASPARKPVRSTPRVYHQQQQQQQQASQQQQHHQQASQQQQPISPARGLQPSPAAPRTTTITTAQGGLDLDKLGSLRVSIHAARGLPNDIPVCRNIKIFD